MQISIRKFTEHDIADKVRWINDPRNNRYLHYDLPLEEEKTLRWFYANKDRTDRYDAVIELNGAPVGVIGLLGIDRKNGKAEYYITLGEEKAAGKGVATTASQQLLCFAFEELGLNRVYLYTERENFRAQRLFERVGFRREGLLRQDLFSRGRYVDRYAYAVTREQFYQKKEQKPLYSPVQALGEFMGNQLYIKREDLIPFSFGGNKARKALLFFEEIEAGGYDTVVTYGSGSSNHCRVAANMAAQKGLDCMIISPEETAEETLNTAMMRMFGAEIIVCPVERVSETIEHTLSSLRGQGKKPYFIPGGGHGNIGTQAFVNCYEEIRTYEAENGMRFDCIFLASGTGTTQAGLVAGQMMHAESRRIVGVSIARRNPRGRQVVVDSVRDYLKAQGFDCAEEQLEESVEFTDEFVLDGYGAYDADVSRTIETVMRKYGIPLNAVYTGKAFSAMGKIVEREGISGKNILFLHTGGAPLYFDWLRSETR